VAFDREPVNWTHRRPNQFRPRLDLSRLALKDLFGQHPDTYQGRFVKLVTNEQIVAPQALTMTSP
jgi:hypothetical protein